MVLLLQVTLNNICVVLVLLMKVQIKIYVIQGFLIMCDIEVMISIKILLKEFKKIILHNVHVVLL